jgi:tetratricopeptide (TPR) repeat protein
MSLWEDIALFTAFLLAAGLAAWRWLQRTREDPGWLISKWLLTAFLFPLAVIAVLKAGPLGMPILIVCSLIMGCLWAPTIGALIARPLTSLYEGGHMDLVPEPRYSIAESRRKHGDYQAAMEELRSQLATFPNHFKLQLNIAEIQAFDLRDLSAAEQTIQEILSQPGHTPGEISIALNWLSDCRLRLAHDRAGARAALEEVIRLFPDTEQARMAEQRIAHMTPAEMLAAAEDRPEVVMPPGIDRVGLLQAPVDMQPEQESPATAAARLVKHLELHPHDIEAREQLSELYAVHYGRVDLAIDQLEQMIADPHQSQRQAIHWLNKITDLHLRFAGDIVAAAATLDRIIDGHPQSAASDAAMNRKLRLKLEIRSKKESQVVKLGSYEQNIGLKRRR